MITTKEQLEEALVAYKKELESKFTIDALRALYPKGAITTKTIELKQFYGRTISITDLEAIIKEAKSVGTNHIYIFERRFPARIKLTCHTTRIEVVAYNKVEGSFSTDGRITHLFCYLPLMGFTMPSPIAHNQEVEGLGNCFDVFNLTHRSIQWRFLLLCICN